MSHNLKLEMAKLKKKTKAGRAIFFKNKIHREEKADEKLLKRKYLNEWKLKKRK